MPFWDAFRIRYGKNSSEMVGNALDDLYSKIGDIGGAVDYYADLSALSVSAGTIYWVRNDTGTRLLSWFTNFRPRGYYIWTGSVWEDAEKYIKWSQITSQVENLWQTATVGGAGLYAQYTIINYNGSLYLNLTGVNTDTAPSSDTTNWALLSGVVQQYVTVAKTGGQFTTIQGAIDSITDSSISKRYSIKVFPGTYTENITFGAKNYIDIDGSGNLNTVLAGNIVFNANHVLSNISIQKTITTNETIANASTVTGGGLIFENILFVISTSTTNVKPVILSINKDNFTTIGSFQVNYVNTSNAGVVADTHLIELSGSGTYIFLQSLYSIASNQSSGNVTTIYDNNAGITRIGTAINPTNMSNSSWNGIYRFIHYVNNNSNKHLISQLEGDVQGAGTLGSVYFINNDSGGSITRILSSRVFIDDTYVEKCVARATNVGDEIDFTFCEKSENITDAEAYCGAGTVSVMARNDGEMTLKNTDLVDLDTLIGTPTYRSLQDMFDINFNAGWIIGQTVTDNGDGTTNFSSGSGYIRTSNSDNAPLKSFDIDAVTNVSYSTGATYVYNDYNSGTPTVSTTQVSATVLDNENDKYEIYEVYKESDGELHITPHFQRVINIGAQLQKYLYSKARIERANAEGGLILGESADNNRYVNMSAGKAWIKLFPIEISAFDSSGADTFTRYYGDTASGFTKVTGQTIWDNDNYWNGSALTSLSLNKYAFHDLWVESDGDITSVYAQDQYNTQAVAENAPLVEFPDFLEDHALYIGRITFQKGDTIAKSVLSPFTGLILGATSVTIHNSLSLIQGGTAGEYYHLNATDYGNLTDVNAQLADLHTDGSPTFADLDVDNININGNTISSTSGDLNLTPVAGSQIVLDGAIEVDGEVFTNVLSGGGFTFNCENNGSSPEGAFVITNGLSGQSYNKDSDSLILDSSGQTLVRFLSENSSGAGLIFGDSDDADVGSIQYSHSTNRIDLRVNNSATYSQQWLSGGEVVMALQPNFEAYKTTSPTNVTGDGTVVTVIFDSEFSDVGSNFNTSTGIFTAPVSGYYNFTSTVRFSNVGAGHTSGLIFLVTSNKTLYGNYNNPYASGQILYSGAWNSIWMDNGDTAKIDFVISGGTKTITLYGNASFYATFFSGGLKD